MHTTFKPIEIDPVTQVLKEIQRALKPEQPGRSSSIHLEVMRM